MNYGEFYAYVARWCVFSTIIFIISSNAFDHAMLKDGLAFHHGESHDLAPLAQAALMVIEISALFGIVVFAYEWFCRLSLSSSPLNYQLSFSGFFDLMGWLPLAGWVLTDSQLCLALAGSCVLFKLERYVQSFVKFREILSDNGAIFVVLGYCGIVTWIICSALFYLTERDNPDADMAATYASAPVAMWMTLLNLSGESPVCEYTMVGKWISVFLGAVAVF